MLAGTPVVVIAVLLMLRRRPRMLVWASLVVRFRSR